MANKLDEQKPTDRPESPTTAKALDFEDDPTETPASPPKTATPSGISQSDEKQDVPPPKPPRPLAPEQQKENTLKEAFPSIDPAVVKAVLRASGGQLEPAFNALLGDNSGDFQSENIGLLIFRNVGSGRSRASSTASTSKKNSGFCGPNFYTREPNGSG